MKISLSTWLRAFVIGWLLLLSSSLQATPPKASDIDYEFHEQGVSVGTENRLVIGGDRSEDAPVPIETFPSMLSNRSSSLYSGNSGVSPYDLLESIPEDELFIADTGEDLDQYLFKERSPLTFNIDIKRYFGEVDSDGRLQNLSAMIENGVIEETAKLRLRVWDVDDDYQGTEVQPERDVVKINGYVLPKPLSSGNDTWDTLSYSVPVEYLRFPELGSGSTRANKIEILIDEDNPLEDHVWAVEVDWATLRVRGLRPLVLIHGYRAAGLIGGNYKSWDNFVDYLNDRHIPYCLPGDGTTCGNNDPIKGTDCIRNNGNAINGVVEEALDRFGVSQVNLVTHSKGGLDARYYLRHHDPNGERTNSFIQLGTPNHGARFTTGIRAGCANRNLNPDWLNENFNYTILDIDNDPWSPFDNQREFIPAYLVEQSATTGRFRHAIGDDGKNNDPDHGDGIVNHHSATPPWSVDCEQKDHRDSNTDDCPRFIVNMNDSWEDTVTWPLVVNLDQIFNGPGHGANSYRTQDFNWVIGEIRNMTESSQTSTQRFRHSVQQRTPASSVQRSSTSRKYLVFRRQFVEVLPGNAHSYSITIGLADSVLFEVGHLESTTLEVSLTDPDGVVHTAQQHVELGAVVERFEIQNPTQGKWTLMVNSGESQQYSLVVYEKGSPIKLKASSDRKNYNIGDAVYLIGTLTNAGAPILGATVIADVSEPSGTSQSFVLYDDGTHGDPTPGDGMYVNNEYVASQEGEIRYTFSATDEVTFQRQQNGSSIVVQESAQLTDVYTENVVDENGDGLYDELIIGVEINFLVVAPYEVFANLKDTNGSLIESLVTQFTPTQTGISTVQLRFDGKTIAEHGVNGPYQLNSLVLRRSLDTNYATVDYREDAYTTNAYQVDDFQGALIKLISVDSGEGVDSDGDGFFNYLVIQVEVDVVIPGTYQTNARLVTQNGTEIDWTSETQSLGPGPGVISLTFDGQKIRQTAENGPYILKDFVIAGQGTSLSLVEVSDTEAFNFDEFEPIDIADFSIESEDLLLSTPIPLPGETIDISALVHNVGASTDEDIVVRIYEGNPLTSGSQIGNDHFIPGLTTGETSMVSENWTAPLSPGNYDIYVWVNPDRDVQEFDYNNNRAFKTVIVKLTVKPLQFAASTVEVAENASTVTLTVRRVGGTNGELTVNYATTDGTATDGNDYVGTTGSLTWADGDSSDKTLTVTISDDSLSEGNETFTVTLGMPISGESLDSATVTISDDDPTLVTLASFTATALEEGIKIEWQSAFELDNAGFHIWRATGEGWKYGDYSTVIRLTDRLIPAQGNSIPYSYIDSNVETGLTYYYGLEDIDLSGHSTFHWDYIDSATAK
jgi:pimeloyl-ACP methyl ester carboxylesterase